MSVIDKPLLAMLVCPLTGEPLQLQDSKLVNDKWGIKYPVRDGIPVMVPDEAELPESIESLRQLKARIRNQRRG